jgi:hypothetical protein
LRQPPVSKAILAKECLKKGIPINFERGEHKGERKPREALRKCRTQKDRNFVHMEKPLLLPAPSAKPSPAPVKSASSPLFLRPAVAELNKMKRDEIVSVYQKGQHKGYIDPSRTHEQYTKEQMIDKIRRATQKKW